MLSGANDLQLVIESIAFKDACHSLQTWIMKLTLVHSRPGTVLELGPTCPCIPRPYRSSLFALETNRWDGAIEWQINDSSRLKFLQLLSFNCEDGALPAWSICSGRAGNFLHRSHTHIKKCPLAEWGVKYKQKVKLNSEFSLELHILYQYYATTRSSFELKHMDNHAAYSKCTVPLD